MTPIKLFFVFLAALVIEIASTFYITAVAERDMFQMMFWAFIGPFLSLPFLTWQIEAKSWRERIILAAAYGLGYLSGAFVVMQFIQNS